MTDLRTLQTELPRLLKMAEYNGYGRVADGLRDAIGGMEDDLEDERLGRIEHDRELAHALRTGD